MRWHQMNKTRRTRRHQMNEMRQDKLKRVKRTRRNRTNETRRGKMERARWTRQKWLNKTKWNECNGQDETKHQPNEMRWNELSETDETRWHQTNETRRNEMKRVRRTRRDDTKRTRWDDLKQVRWTRQKQRTVNPAHRTKANSHSHCSRIDMRFPHCKRLEIAVISFCNKRTASSRGWMLGYTQSMKFIPCGG